MARLFISQERLDAWAAEERVKIEGEVMTLHPDGRAFKIVPALRFLKVSGGGEDTHKLLGKVKSVESIVAQGGEHYMDSVILGEIAYDVQQGFLGNPVGGPAKS